MSWCRAIAGGFLFSLTTVAACGGTDASIANPNDGSASAQDGHGGGDPSTNSDASTSSSGGGDASVNIAAIGPSLEQHGFAVGAGAFEFLDMSKCCASSCSGNNPTSPYGAFFIPPAPGQTVVEENVRADGKSFTYRLRADEAIVYVGKTPPKARYFGFTPYLMDRLGDQGLVRRPIFASLSETLNNLVIGTTGGGVPFEQTTAVVAAADTTTVKNVSAALVDAGVPASAINTLVIDPAQSRFGLEAGADTFGVLFRLALVEDAAKKEAYLTAPGGSVFRVTPKTIAASAPLAAAAARPKGVDAKELDLRPAVQRLASAIMAAHPGFDGQAVLVSDGVIDPAACIAQNRFCAGDNRDTTYPAILPRDLFTADDDFYVVFGVDHQVSGKVTYANVSVYAVEHLVGLASVSSDKYAGSAKTYLPADPDAPKLYAWKIARSCNGAPFCLEIPKGACPTGIDNGANGSIAFRTYLEPSTKTAPDPATIVRDRVIRFKKL